ncbi:MAG: prepilin peptidase [Candidatus Saccharibacteria bacterium]|nr:prepilin peptidase [Candidatus Saccharibacteria bacterium]
MITVFMFIIGLAFGSFVNAFVWRLKKNKNWVSGRSICTYCKHKLASKDLIPVVSWLTLRGKCRYCHKKIDDSPLTELAVGAIFASSYRFWPFVLSGEGWFMLVVWLIAVVLLAAMFLYDVKWMILPNKLTYALLALAIVQVLILFVIKDFDFETLKLALFSSAVGGGLFHLIYLGSKGKYIGGGDVKLGYAYGLLLLDPILPWLALIVASTTGSLIAIFLLANKRAKFGTKLPFGPMLIGGVLVAMIWGSRLWDFTGRLWY